MADETTNQTKPVIFDYRDPRLFLKETYRYLKATDSGYTIRRWSLEMGLKSPKALIEMLEGKRPIKMRYIDFLLKGMDLDPSDRLYFQALVLYTQASTTNEKMLYEILLSHLAPQKEISVERSAKEGLFSHWLHGLILSLARLESFQLNEDSIKEVSRHDISLDEIRSSIKTLKSLGYLTEDSDGKLHKPFDFVSTPNEKLHVSGRSYIQQVTELAKKAVHMDMHERELQCFSIGIKKRDIEEFKSLLRSVRQQLYKLSSLDGDCIYQVNLQLFPLTNDLSKAPSEQKGQIDHATVHRSSIL